MDVLPIAHHEKITKNKKCLNKHSLIQKIKNKTCKHLDKIPRPMELEYKHLSKARLVTCEKTVLNR